MSVRANRLGIWCARALTALVCGCAVSAAGGEDEDADLSLTADPRDWDAAAPDARPMESPDADVTAPEAAVPSLEAGAGMPPLDRDAGSDPTKRDAAVTEPDATMETLPLTLDGEVRDQEWSAATWTTQSTPSNWGTTKNVLLSLGVVVKDGALWLALRGMIENTNAMVVYFDSTAGVGLAPSAVRDETGALDAALSASLLTSPGFQAELAWGTRSMGISATSGFNEGTGFRRLIDASPDDLAWIDGSEAPSVCSLTACEARIPLTFLGAGSSVSLFARISSGDGTSFANQTLPADAAESPALVNELLTIAR